MYVSTKVRGLATRSGPETRPMKVKDTPGSVNCRRRHSQTFSQSPAMHDGKHDRPRNYPWLAASQHKCPAVGVPEP